jgi:hypothetical protein
MLDPILYAAIGLAEQNGGPRRLRQRLVDLCSAIRRRRHGIRPAARAIDERTTDAVTDCGRRVGGFAQCWTRD